MKTHEFAKIPDEIKNKWEIRPSGGGMLIHTNREDKGIRDIILYGYSIPFGKADHNKAHYILANDFPAYKIRWSNST